MADIDFYARYRAAQIIVGREATIEAPKLFDELLHLGADAFLSRIDEIAASGDFNEECPQIDKVGDLFKDQPDLRKRVLLHVLNVVDDFNRGERMRKMYTRHPHDM